MSMLHNRIASLLLLGDQTQPGGLNSNSVEELERIQAAAEGLLGEWHTIEDRRESGRVKLEAMREEVRRERERMEGAGIQEKHRALREEIYTQKFLKMGKMIDELEEIAHTIESSQQQQNEEGRSDHDNTSATKIQSTILTMLESLPHRAIPTRSKLFQHLQAKTGKLKDTLLRYFHAKFEQLLEEDGGGQSTSSSSTGADAWSGFLSHSRDWLLAFVMASLLPKILSESDTMILECYHGALDDALTPLWGRYRFHLAHASESGSKRQIIWSFHYAREFSHILHDLCAHLGDSVELLRFFAFRVSPLKQQQQRAARGVNEDDNHQDAGAEEVKRASSSSDGNSLVRRYRSSAVEWMLEKSSGLFRAHLAKVLLILTNPVGAASLPSMLGGGPDDEGKHDNNKDEDADEDEQAVAAASTQFLAAVEPDSSSLRAFCLHLLEETLSLDNFLGTLLVKPQVGGTVSTPSTLATARSLEAVVATRSVGVLCASLEFTGLWVACDLDFMLSRLDEIVGCRTDPSGFQDAFSSAFSGSRAGPSPFHGPSASVVGMGMGMGDDTHSLSSSSHDISSSSLSSSFCYLSVFDTLSLFMLACRRYGGVPAHRQTIFSTWILEPMLALAVLLLMVHVRRDPTLCDLSNGTVSEEVRSAARAVKGGGTCPRPVALERLVLCVEYINAMLAQAKSYTGSGTGTDTGTSIVGSIATEDGNFQSLWDEGYEWLPRNVAYMNDAGLRHVENTLFPKLLQQVMPRAQGAEGGGDDEDCTDRLAGFVKSLRDKEEVGGDCGSSSSSMRAASSAPLTGMSTLGRSIDQARAQAVTLASVLEKQYQKTLEMAVRLQR